LKRLFALVRAHFLVRAALWFFVFALPWPGVAEAYTSAVADGLGVMLGRSGPPVAVSFHAGEPGLGPWEVQTRVSESATGRALESALDERRTGYLPAAVFLALTLASTFPWRKKLVLAASGLFAIHLLSLLPILSFWSGRLPIVAYELDAPVRVVVDVLYHALVAPLGMAYALPGLLWLVLRAAADAPVEPEPSEPAQPTTTARSRRGRSAPAANRQSTGVTTR
jgi:hypothetical protein